METMTVAGTEKRVDDLSKRVDDMRSEMREGFHRVDADVRELRADTNARFDAMQRPMIGFFATTLGSIIGGFVLVAVSHR